MRAIRYPLRTVPLTWLVVVPPGTQALIYFSGEMDWPSRAGLSFASFWQIGWRQLRRHLP